MYSRYDPANVRQLDKKRKSTIKIENPAGSIDKVSGFKSGVIENISNILKPDIGFNDT
jgi:hypothetical protein